MNHLSIRHKIVLISTVLAAVFLGAVLWFVIYQTYHFFSQNIIDNAKQETSFYTQELTFLIEEVEADVRSLTEMPPIQGMQRALDNGDTLFDVEGNSSYDVWRSRLANIFESVMKEKTYYDQLRYIDTQGQEIVRVNQEISGPVILSEEDMQNKLGKEYVTQGNILGKGTSYVSSISLNREGADDAIESPPKPVARYVIPIFDSFGKRRGMIVANVRMQTLLDKLQIHAGNQDEFFLVDSEGYYIQHPDAKKMWGAPWDLNTGESFLLDYPDLAEYIFSSKIDGEGQNIDSIYTYSWQELSSDKNTIAPKVLLFRKSSTSLLFQPFLTVIYGIALISVIAFIILFLIFSLSIKKVLSPLQVLTAAAREYEDKNFDAALPEMKHDEVGVLTQQFKNMAASLKGYYQNLGSEVEKKTESLEDKVNELQQTKTAMLNVMEDIQEEKQRYALQVQETEKFKMAVENASDHIVITDPEGIVLYANAAAEKITGFRNKDILGKKAGSLWHMPMPQPYYEEFWKRIKTEKKVFVGDIQNKRKNGEVYAAQLSVSPVLDQEGNVQYFVGIERDVTEEKRIDKAKTEFVSLASHQLRTPLSTINWYTEMLLSEDVGKINKDQKAYLEEVYKGSQRMVGLVNALLNVSRIELGTFSVKPEKVQLAALLLDTIAEVNPQIQKKSLIVEQDIQQNIPEVNADPKLINIVMENLITNAIKYTPEKGHIDISLKIKKKRVRGAYVQTGIEFCVKDTGYGIPKAQQGKIFNKLFRADNVTSLDTQGTGLGLYIVKSILDQTGGSISFVSKENKGTTFSIIFPLKGMKEKKGTKTLGE